MADGARRRSQRIARRLARGRRAQRAAAFGAGNGGIMASVVLLVSHGMLMRALWRVQATDPGFRTDGVLTMRTALPTPSTRRRRRATGSTPAYSRRYGVCREWRAQLYTSFLPMTMGGGIWPVSIKGEKLERAGGDVASMRFTTPGFFKTLRIPLLQGREPADSDTSSTPHVAVISQSFVRKYWPDGNAIAATFNSRLATGNCRRGGGHSRARA